MLELTGIDLFYGDAQALDGVSLSVGAGEIVAIIGANGAGKSSLIRTIFGMERARRGSIRFEGAEIAGLPPHRICNLGIGQVAEGRQIFPNLSVVENLEMGAVVPRARAGAASMLARVYDLFPRLAERRRRACRRCFASCASSTRATASPSCWSSRTWRSRWRWRIAAMSWRTAASSWKAAAPSSSPTTASAAPMSGFSISLVG